MFRCAPDHEDGADVSPERQQQGESDQEAGDEGGSDGWYRDTDDSEPDDAADSSEGKGASEDEEGDSKDSPMRTTIAQMTATANYRKVLLCF